MLKHKKEEDIDVFLFLNSLLQAVRVYPTRFVLLFCQLRSRSWDRF